MIKRMLIMFYSYTVFKCEKIKTLTNKIMNPLFHCRKYQLSESMVKN